MFGRRIAVGAAAPRISPSRFSNATWAIATIALFAFVFGLRASVYNPNDGLGLLFCLPIALAAVRFGPWVGLSSGFIAFAFYAVWAHHSSHVVASPVGYTSRLIVFLVLGGFIGYYARARAELDVRSRLLFDLSPDLMGTLAADGRVISANDAWHAVAGRNGSATPLLPDWRLELPAGEHATAFEQTFEPENGPRRTIEWFVQRDEQRQLLYVVGRDVTERIAREAHVRELLTTVQGARASERARIASELHDFVLQQLLVALMHAERAETVELGNVDRFVRTAIAALRGVIDGIEPLDMQHLDIGTVLERAVNAVAQEWDVAIASDVTATGDVDPDTKLLAFRLAGEALRNAAKHANAQSVRLEANERDSGLHIAVIDDGSGLPEPVDVTDALVPHYGTGFNLLLQQVLANAGHTRIVSTPGVGTSVTFDLQNS